MNGVRRSESEYSLLSIAQPGEGASVVWEKGNISVVISASLNQEKLRSQPLGFFVEMLVVALTSHYRVHPAGCLVSVL